MENRFTLEKVDEPKGTFLFTISQYSDRQAMIYFIDDWLKTYPDINEFHHGATLLDRFYDCARLYHHYLDIQYLRHLSE
ncbi:unnamed protein product [Rotaria sp. Silwood2]|nr:unnamed protein product [Rotaria sp. Silwood2]CAF4152885.1 unnamed protein product [Rotaria sp. Silwood2]